MIELESLLQILSKGKPDENYSKTIGELMALYTVRSPSHITVRLQSAIEFYGKKQDAANQKYFVQKMTSLNEQIKTVLDRQQRINAKSNNALSEAQPQQRERSQPQTQNAFRAMRKENEVEFNKYT